MTTTLTGSTIAVFLVVLARAGGLILSAPVVGDAQVPRMVKAGLAIALSLVLVQTPHIVHARVPNGLMPFALVIVAQLLVGIVLGLMARAIFLAVQTAGQIVGLQTGLSSASVFNPMNRQPDTVLSQFYTLVAALAFLAVDGDSLVVGALARSFDLAPLTAGAFSSHLLDGLISTLMSTTELGLQIAMPIAASLFVANLVLALISRSLPQLNVFMLSLPIGIMLGLVALIASIAGTLLIIGRLTNGLPQTMLGPLVSG